MGKNVAEGLWEMLVSAGVRRCYGIVGDALNPVIDALRRNGSVEFVHVRHEEYGVFAAVAEARLTGNPVAVCGTAERGPVVISLPGDVAEAAAPSVSLHVPLPATTIGAASVADLTAMAGLINQAQTVAIFGGTAASRPRTRCASSRRGFRRRSGTASRASRRPALSRPGRDR